MFATAGNLSVKSNLENSFWITASGKHKGHLTEDDFVRTSISGLELLESSQGNKASAETSIHASIYRFQKKANAALHVHTLDSNLLSFHTTQTERFKLVPIPPIEIIKAFGIWEERPNLQMAVFYNFGNVKQIAESIERFFETHPDYPLPFVLVEEHGPTVWGNSIQDANRHLEAVSFLFQVMTRSK